MNEEWLLSGATKDTQSIAADWKRAPFQPIAGVRVHEIANVPKAHGFLTEVFRADWKLDGSGIDQVFQVALNPGAVSAWHAHATTTDRLFVSAGLMCIVLYDARDDSPTRGVVNEHRFGTIRPALVVIPPRVWHGVQNIAHTVSVVLNLVDRAYRYDDPDHWRLPEDSPLIPFRFRPCQ